MKEKWNDGKLRLQTFQFSIIPIRTLAQKCKIAVLCGIAFLSIFISKNQYL
jgi:hypothetical protein